MQLYFCLLEAKIKRQYIQIIRVGPVKGCQEREDKRPNVGGPLLLISGGATSVNA